jgi:hypothetical protein
MALRRPPMMRTLNSVEAMNPPAAGLVAAAAAATAAPSWGEKKERIMF